MKTKHSYHFHHTLCARFYYFLYYLSLSAAVGTCLERVVVAQQTITLLSRTKTSGVLKSTSPGGLTLVDKDGRQQTFKIQGKGERGVSLAGAQAIVNFPATVKLTGEQPVSGLAKGSSIGFTIGLNRLGRSEDVVQSVTMLNENQQLGAEFQGAVPKGGDFAPCAIRGEVYSYRNQRLMVTIPRSKNISKQRLVFQVAEGAMATIESDDYRQASPGDEVVHLLAAKFDTGDTVIQELTIRLKDRSDSEGAKSTSNAPENLNRYRHLSNAPSRPRDVRSAHFVLHTDLSDRSAKILLDKLETMLGFVAIYYKRLPKKPIECYVVRDLQQWGGALPQEGVAKIAAKAGVTLSRSLGDVTRSVVYSCEDHGVVQHEAIHAYCNETFGDAGPTWYAEGMAEMGQYWKKGRLAVDVDPVVIDYLKNAPPKSMLAIVAAGQITGDSWQAYSWRWALCHLLASNPNYSGRFQALGVGLMTQQPGVSFEAVYGPVAREISFEYDQFVRCLDNGYRADLCAWQWNKKFLPLLARRRAKVKIAAARGWQASGIRIEAGKSYEYAAEGSWKSSDGEETDAEGNAQGRGKLLGVFMNDYKLSKPFELGKRGSFKAPQSGDLYLRRNEAWTRIADTEGEVTVHFRLKP